ncbi:MAG: ribonuclease P protein component [Planctomycetes bacterium]|nr:ribonuclease P protein component [Planctomycetota bacterium]
MDAAKPTQPRKTLSKKARLTSKRDFDGAFADGVRAHGSLLGIVLRRSPDGETRVGVPCGKRFSKRAVDRNRFRRLAREAFRLHRDEWPKGCEIVILPRCKPDACNFQLFEKELKSLVAKALRYAPPAPIPPPVSGKL